jgi:hypothetical protein
VQQSDYPYERSLHWKSFSNGISYRKNLPDLFGSEQSLSLAQKQLYSLKRIRKCKAVSAYTKLEVQRVIPTSLPIAVEALLKFVESRE